MPEIKEKISIVMSPESFKNVSCITKPIDEAIETVKSAFPNMTVEQLVLLYESINN